MPVGQRKRERAGYFMVVLCTFFRELLHGSTSVIRLLDTGYVHGLDHLASFFEKLSKLMYY